MADPFTLVHDAIWDCLEAYSGFTDLVGESNRIDLTGASRAPNKQAKNTADYPQVRVVPAGADTPELRDTSDDGKVMRSYEIQISTGTMLAGGTVYPGNIYNIEWNIYKALLNWKNYWGPMSSLTITGEDDEEYNFVTSMDFGASEQGVDSGALAEQNIGGWNTLLTLKFFMTFPRAAFAPSIE